VKRAPWQEPVRGGYPAPSVFGRSGRDQLRTLLTQGPIPPIGRLTGLLPVEAGDGTARFEMPLTDWLRVPQGAIPIGVLAMPADGALACAIQTQLPPATPFTTSELSLLLLRPAPPGTRISVEGRVLHRRRSIALADAVIYDEQQEPIGHGSTLCFVLDPIPGIPSDDSRPTDAAVDEHDTPDPWRRPVQGTVLGAEVWAQLSGRAVLERQLTGELPPPPIHHLTGLMPTAVGDGEATFVMPASEWLCAPIPGRVQGGAVALLAETALSGAIQTTTSPGIGIAPIDFKINFVRRLIADGRPARATGRVLHAGRRLAVASSEVRDADGKLTALATGSAMIVPARLAAAPARS
jgi:uncharacterized protein (TIGR00369 family)